MKVFATAANLNDREGLADAGYAGEEVERQVCLSTGIQLEITKRSEQRFVVIPRRWIIECSIAWINRYRRLSKDYEYRTTTEESMIYMTGIRLMLRRISSHE